MHLREGGERMWGIGEIGGQAISLTMKSVFLMKMESALVMLNNIQAKINMGLGDPQPVHIFSPSYSRMQKNTGLGNTALKYLWIPWITYKYPNFNPKPFNEKFL